MRNEFFAEHLKPGEESYWGRGCLVQSTVMNVFRSAMKKVVMKTRKHSSRMHTVLCNGRLS